MKILHLLLLLGALSLVLQCEPNTQNKHSNSPSPIDELLEEVMAVHDKVMPEMGTIHRLRKKLKQRLSDGIEDPALKEKIQATIKTLDDADEGMMSWMAAFKMPKEDSNAAKLNYLKEQQLQIAKVKEDILNAIEMAKSLVE